jgi:hypothetical protein
MLSFPKQLGVAIALATVIVLGHAVTRAQVSSSAGQVNTGPERFTAFAINMNSPSPTAGATSVDIVINRYSTDAERDRLRAGFKENEQQGLLKALQDLPAVGYLTTPGSLRYDIHFARQRPAAEAGRRLFLLTDRRIAFWEAASGARTLDYPFTLIQIQLDRNDRGVGKLSVATRITGSEDTVVEIEDFAAQPVQLNDVHKVKG